MFQNHCWPRTLLTNFFFSSYLSVSSGLEIGPLEDDGEAGKAKMSFASRTRRFRRERVHTHSRQGLRLTGLMTLFFLHYVGYLGYQDGCTWVVRSFGLSRGWKDMSSWSLFQWTPSHYTHGHERMLKFIFLVHASFLSFISTCPPIC